MQKEVILDCWLKAIRKFQCEATRWMHATGPMTAAICTLIDAGWKPIHPTKWLQTRTGRAHDFYEVPEVSHHFVLHEFET